MIGDLQKSDYSLYIHIPFCSKKCNYCHFFVIKDQQKLHSELVEAIKHEFDEYLDYFRDKNLISIYFGGGTPSLLSADHIFEILNHIQTKLKTNFKSVEITLEANPEKIDKEKIANFKQAGINRLSIGVQSFNDSFLNKLTRTHDKNQAHKAIELAYKAGIDNISIDLMYELPGQTLMDWQEDLKVASTLPISHISLYNLSIEPKTVLYKQKGELLRQMPTPEIAIEMYLKAQKVLTAHEFTQYEISAFCKNKKYSRHNTGYWQGRDFIGLGPSAFSYWHGSRFQNSCNFNKYIEKIKQNKSATEFKEALSLDQKLRELLIINLRLTSGLNIANFEKNFGSLSSSLWSSLEDLANQKLLFIGQNYIRLSDSGLLNHDEIAAYLV